MTNNKRLFDRVNVEGIFIYKDISYEIVDISVGGLKILEQMNGLEAGTIVNGKIGLNPSGVRIYSDVICEILELSPSMGTRLKFITASEEFTEFLRSLELRHQTLTQNKASWLGSSSYKIKKNEKRNWLNMKGIFRVELFISLVILATALFLLLKASTEQNFWVVATHEIVATASGELNWLRSDGVVSVNDEVASISVQTLNNQQFELKITSNVKSQAHNFNFNIGDQIAEGDIIGVMNSVPVDDENIKVLLGFQSPILHIVPGDVVKISTSKYSVVDATVQYSLTPTQASALTSVSPDSFRFEEYLLATANLPPDAVLSGQPRVDVVRTIMSRLGLGG